MTDADTEIRRSQREFEEELDSQEEVRQDIKVIADQIIRATAEKHMKYLPHYVGQKCFTPKGEGIITAVFRLCEGSTPELCQCVRVSGIVGMNDHEPFAPQYVQPILRRSTHITEEEALKVAELWFTVGCPLHIKNAMKAIRNSFGSWFVNYGPSLHDSIMCNDVNNWDFVYNNKQVLYLMNRGVDVFGAITDGAALDITVYSLEHTKPE